MFGRSREVLIYVAAVLMPTAALLSISFRSVLRQQDAIEVLRKANLDLNIERRDSLLALEKRRLAGACLRDLQPSLFPAAIATWRTIHPIAKHFFIWRNGRLLFPPVESEPKPVAANPLISEGERLEFQAHSLDRAISCYRWARAQDLSPYEKALALAREARCLRKLGRRAEATAIWQSLSENYADVRDPYGRPYALVAVWEANASASRLESTCREFVNGRWQLSVDHAEYYQSRFQQASPGCLAGGSSEFLELVQLAKALDPAPSHFAASHAVDGNSFVLARGAENYEIWYDTREEASGRTTVGFALDSAWVDRNLVPKLPSLPVVQLPIEGTWIFWWVTFAFAITMLLGLFLVSRAAWRESLLSRGKAEFLAGISHDMKTPLAVIQQHTEELMEDSSLNSADRMANYDVIQRQIEKLVSSIDNSLSFARQDHRPAPSERVLQDPLPVLEGVAEGFRKRLQGSEFSLLTEFESNLPNVTIHADSISRALSNLLENAVKYSSPPATVRLRARTHGRWLEIDVEDQGVGIPARYHRHIFEPYVRLKNGLYRQGIGLGLRVVKQVMNEHRGRVQVISRQNGGATFRLLLPLGERASTPPHDHGNNSYR